jgi:hypothetical protein
MSEYQIRQQRLEMAQGMTAAGLKAGVHPRQIRERLAVMNLPAFKYSMVRHQGKRELARRKAQGSLCATNCGNKVQPPSDLCAACLTAKWGLDQ